MSIPALYALMREDVYLAVYAVVAARWVLSILHLAARAGGGASGAWERAVRVHRFLGASTSGRLRQLGTTDRQTVAAEHQALVTESREFRSQALLIGSLALAAWAILATDSGGALDTSSLTLDFLLVGVILTIAGPLLFGTLGSLYPYFGLRLSVGLGYGALVLGLASLVPLIMTGWRSIVFEGGILAALLTGEFLAYRSSLELNDNLTARRMPAPRPAPLRIPFSGW